jgi:hypothetical protein
VSEFFIAGGFGMYPTLLFGFLSVAASVLYLLRPDRQSIALVVSLGVATVAAGFLGFASGVMTTLRYIDQVPAADRFTVACAGCEESLHCVSLALIPTIITALICAVGAFRASRVRAPVTRGALA